MGIYPTMKLAVLSDIHGNLPALEAVLDDIDRWAPDRVLVNGDIVNSGPDSAACWALITGRRRDADWVVLRGNHEEYVAEWAWAEPPRTGQAYELIRLSHWTYDTMQAEAPALAALPDRWDMVSPDGARLVAMHASLLGNRVGIYPFTSDDDVRRRTLPETQVFITAHTHIPHLRRLDSTQIVNVGSVGLPGDGDRRASYGRLCWEARQGWTAAIERVSYDWLAAERAFVDSGYLAQAGPEAAMSLVELRLARDIRTRWSAIYREGILAGTISHAEAVRRFLEAETITPSFATAA